MKTASQKPTLKDLTDEELLRWAAQRGVIATPDDWNPSIEEIRSHDTDPSPVTEFAGNPKINAELKARGLKGRSARPW
jgi:hypothetical protein